MARRRGLRGCVGGSEGEFWRCCWGSRSRPTSRDCRRDDPRTPCPPTGLAPAAASRAGPCRNSSCRTSAKRNSACQTHQNTSNIDSRGERLCDAHPMSAATDAMFAPPVNRAMKVLDRSFFQRTIPTSAARIFNPKDISRCRNDLDKSRDALKNRLMPIRPDPDEQRAQKGGKCLLLRPEVIHNGMTHAFCEFWKC